MSEHVPLVNHVIFFLLPIIITQLDNRRDLQTIISSLISFLHWYQQEKTCAGWILFDQTYGPCHCYSFLLHLSTRIMSLLPSLRSEVRKGRGGLFFRAWRWGQVSPEISCSALSCFCWALESEHLQADTNANAQICQNKQKWTEEHTHNLQRT